MIDEISNLKKNIDDHINVIKSLITLESEVLKAGSVMSGSLLSGGKVLFCGNGGSAADSQHLAAELTGRFVKDRPPIAAVALSTDTSALTSISNDYSYEEVFSRQVRAIGRPGDVLLAISTSGNSRNVIRAVEESRRIGIFTIGLLGHAGGSLLGTCDCSIVVASEVTARIQEAHILIGHTLCELIERDMGYA